ncbi:unnamed protein product [Anisakis simplex]|uniref:Myelin regulatory factor (inferred by orthology to a human protein) n=1 Tax=Anisakis simplex TaxID=6269 RepID=A0A0M3JZP4_ANISI|nr:unnamed protein product [Anisakis simplex]
MAKRKFAYSKGIAEESAYSDPLSDCTGDFNILQFLDDSDTPVDSPVDSTRIPLHQVQGRNNTTVPDPINEMMYQNPARLPDSPPITDISGAGSSGSPSSASDSPYSPDTYQNYQGRVNLVHGNQSNGNGLILGVPPDVATQMLMPQELITQSHQLGNRILQHTLPSPQSDFMGAYTAQSTPAPLPQTSPSSANIRQVNSGGYMIQNNGYQVDPYTNMMNNVNEISPQNNADAATNRKRLRTDTHPSNNAAHIKNEPQKIYSLPSQLSIVPSPVTTDEFDDAFHQQAIKFSRFNEEQWAPLFDVNQRPLHQLEMHVVADKGFNYSNMDSCFVNQKKNHFQISVHIEAIDSHPPSFVKVGNELKLITEFKLAFCGVKSEMPSSEIQIKQSTTDRRPVPHDPVSLEIHERRMTKVTVPRLHFSETTMNNQRKNGRPNPDQKYFLLVVRLIACTADGLDPVVQAYQSEKVIVRASNPGQFEPPDSDVAWQKNGSTLFYNNGSVAIGMDRAMAPLTVGGDIYCSGVVHRPSDRRVKEEIHEVDTKDAMSRLAQIRVVGYSYKPEIALQWGLSEENRHRVGVIAQELAEILPDAVTDNGDFLQVDDSRIFYETVAAATELCRLTGNLEHKIEAVEKLSNKLAKLHKRRLNKDIGSMASGLSDLGFSDKASFMSSHLSLASTTPSCNSREKCRSREDRANDRKHRHCRNPSCHTSEPLLCSSRFTQGTIVTLVVVMAICLIAMSTLYVLDWHSRTFGYHRRDMPMIVTTTSPETVGNIGNIIEVNKDLWLPPSQPNVPPLAIVCENQHCHTYCCSGMSSQHHYDRSANTKYQKGDMLVGLREQRLTALIPISGSSRATISSHSPLPSGVNIEVITLNMTLDERYCVENSCQPRRGLYTLYVPISPFMPAIPIEIRIDTQDNGNYIDNCGSLRDFDQKACTFDQEPIKTEVSTRPVSRKITDEVYELSVGNYMQSAYRFRIGYSTESCNMSESQRGRSFDEYNIVFYRQCGASQ